MKDLFQQVVDAISSFKGDMRSGEASLHQSVAEIKACAVAVPGASTNYSTSRFQSGAHYHNGGIATDPGVNGQSVTSINQSGISVMNIGAVCGGCKMTLVNIGNTCVKVTGHNSLIINSGEIVVNGWKIDLSKYGNNVVVEVKENGEVYVNGEKID